MFGFDEISKVGLGLGLIKISKMGLGLGLITTPQVGLGLMGSNPFIKPVFEPIDQTHWVCTSLDRTFKMELGSQKWFLEKLGSIFSWTKKLSHTRHPHAEILSKMISTFSIFAIFRPKIAQNRYLSLWRDCRAPKWYQHLQFLFWGFWGED